MRRLSLSIYLESNVTCYVLLDDSSDGSGAASSTNYTIALAQGDFYEVPTGYIGKVTAKLSASGTARITELNQ